MKIPDIFFEESWCRMHADYMGGTYHSYEYEDDHGIVLSRFIKRPTGILPDTYDIVSPWRYCGPIVIQCGKERAELIRSFDRDFHNYCVANNIAAEFARFSPWLKNHEDFRELYEMKKFTGTIGIDLSGDFFNLEFSAKRRGNVRNAEKKGVRTEIDFKCTTVDEFYRLYSLMVKKNKLDAASTYSRKYVQDLVDYCMGNVFIINGYVGDETASSGIFVYSDDYVHYHLCGNDPKFFGLDVNALITYKAAEWGKDNGKRLLDIGSGATDSLFKYKKLFTQEGFYDFYVGSRVHSNELYEELLRLKGSVNDAYFPCYR